MEALQRAQTPHIAIYPTPIMSHLIPLVELARKLVELHGFAITFIIPDDGLPKKQQKALLEAFPAINSIFLPPAICDDIPEDAELRIVLISMIGCIPSLCKVLSKLKESSLLSALIVDFFGTFAFNAVKQMGIPFYLFFPGSALGLSFSLHLPELHQSCTCEYRDLPEPIKLPGCVPIQGSDLVDSVQDRKKKAYEFCVEMCKNFTVVDGILVDSFLELEQDTLKALGGSSTTPPVYAVGPLSRSCSSDISDDKAECLKWLDEQPARSVLFVSFGSGGTLSTEQLKELALGLEMSEQRFLFVARRPHDEVKNAAFFTGAEKETDSFEYLPSGFIERINGKGFVLSDWAPQIEVLSHPSVGGFLSHCGWSSTLESIIHMVPLIAWPLYAEQRMDAVLLTEYLKVALRVRENEKGVVDSEQISKLVRRLIEGEEGEELRNRMKNLKDAAGGAWSQDGSSTKSLANLAEKWKTEIAS